jgi:Cu2+-exporting ATPase
VTRGRELTAEAFGDGRVRIHGAQIDDPRMRRVVRWLAKRPELVTILPRDDGGSLVASYTEPAARAGNFFRALRDRLFEIGRPTPPTKLRVSLAHVVPGRARMRTRNASLEDLARLAAHLASRPGVARVATSEITGSILVLFDTTMTSADALLAAARRSGPAEWPPAPPRPERDRARERTLFDTAVLGATTAGVLPVPVASALVAATAVPVAKRAIRAAREGRLSIDVLDAGAIAISLVTGRPATAALMTWLLGLGDLVLAHTTEHARAAMAKLARIDVVDAWVMRRGRFVRVAASKLAHGDRVRIHAGEQIPADGIVVAGAASVDEKALTGESMPRTRRPGARVLAASVLRAGQIDVDVTRAGEDTTAARIVQILRGAGAKPMTLQRETERIADRVVLPTIALAIAAGAIAADPSRTTSVLITDFGTGIRIAAPTSALAAMTAAAREGILVKGGQYLERLAKTDVVVFDKTGTLTEGEPRIIDVEATGCLGRDEALALAAAAEQTQSHPLARAIRRYAKSALGRAPDLDVATTAYDIGGGVAAEVSRRRVLVGTERFVAEHEVDVDGFAREGSAIYVAVDGRVEMVMSYDDVVRDETRTVLARLRAGGRREIVLMSGDAEATVDRIARQLDVPRRFARMLPEHKADAIRAMQRRGHVVAMVGDGINDAPALAVADVGVSLHGATDVALETADVVLVDGGLAKLPRAFRHADAGMASVRRGFALVVAPNAAAIVLAALGLVGPGVATLINNGSTVAAALASLAPLLGVRR